MRPLRRLPIATVALVLVNLATAYAVVLRPEIPLEHGFQPDHPSLRQAATSLFLHKNVLHLLGNMLFLAAVGGTVEVLSGAFRFLAVYFLGGLAGIAAHALLAGGVEGAPPLVGASGAVASCAAYYCSRYLQVRVPLAPKLGATVAGVTGLWLALQVLGAFVRLGEPAPVSFWAHLGGFLFGLVLSAVFRAPDLAEVERQREAMEHAREESPGAKLALARKRLERNPRDGRALQDLAEVQRLLGDRPGEIETLKTILETQPEPAQALALRRLCELGGAAELPALRRTLLAERFKETDPDLAAALLQSVAKLPDSEPQKPDALLALATLKLETDPDRARALLDELQRKFPLHPACDLARARGLIA